MEVDRGKILVRLVFRLEEAESLDHGMASILESDKLTGRIYQGQDEPLAQARKGAMRLRQAIARALSPEYRKDKRDEYINRMQAVTSPKAVKKWSAWTEIEKAYLLE